MDVFTWFCVCVLVVVVLFVMIFCIALFLDNRKRTQETRVYELRVSENGNVNLREKKNYGRH